MPSEPLFEIENASFSANGRALVGPLSLTIPSGAFIGLIGHNGSGKSTLLKMMARQHPGQGTIRLNGRPLAEWGDRAFAREVAYLPQTTPTSSGMLVRELVALGRYPWHGALGRFSAADRAKVAEALEMTDLGPLADRLVDTLSGGERQRAHIARALAQEPTELLLDEPTNHLDIRHQLELLALVADLPVTAIVALHDLNLAAMFCDSVLVLKGGRAVAGGSPRDVLTPELIGDVYGVRARVAEDAVTGRSHVLFDPAPL